MRAAKVSLIHSCRGEHTDAVSSIGVSGPKDGFASIACNATARRDFLPLPALPSFLALQQAAPAPFSASLRPLGAPAIAFDLSLTIETAMVRLETNRIKENYHGYHRHLQEVRQQRVHWRNRYQTRRRLTLAHRL